MARRLPLWILTAGFWIPIAGFPAWLGAAFWYAWPRTSPLLLPGATLIAHRPEVLARGAWALIGWCLLLFCYLTVRAVRRRPRPWVWQVPVAMGQLGLVTAAALIVLTPFSFTYLLRWNPWRDLAPPRAVKGVTYHLYQRGEALALTREHSKTRWFTRSQAIGVTRGSYTAAAIVRPAKRTEYNLPVPSAGDAAPGRLIVSRSGQWLVFIYLDDEGLDSPVCLLAAAYDLRAARFYAGKALFRLSPFLLIEPRDELNHSDLGSALQGLDYKSSGSTRWPAAVLKQALSNPNPHVRNAAAQWRAKAIEDTQGRTPYWRRVFQGP